MTTLTNLRKRFSALPLTRWALLFFALSFVSGIVTSVLLVSDAWADAVALDEGPVTVIRPVQTAHPVETLLIIAALVSAMVLIGVLVAWSRRRDRES